MNRIRYMAAGLLCVTGMLHMARLGLTEPSAIIIEAFGVVYLLIGGFLFLNKKIAYTLQQSRLSSVSSLVRRS